MTVTTPFLVPVTVTTAGTAVQYVDPNVAAGAPGAPGVRVTPILLKRVEFRAASSNTGSVLIRQRINGTLNAGHLLAKTDFPLVCETEVKGQCFDLNNFFFDAVNSGDKVQVIGTPFRE